jgi:uncharacterized metal-binding protein
MPAGSTHDRITLWTLPLVGGLFWLLSRNGNLTLLWCSGYLLGGLILGPDLDIRSRPYKRWGWLRWIWIPYQRGLRHRSFWSHGPVVGTLVRVVYLAIWLLGVSLLGLMVWSIWQGGGDQWWPVFLNQGQRWRSFLGQWFDRHHWAVGVLLLGLEVGAMSHSLGDVLGSAWKRLKKRWRKRSRSKRRRFRLKDWLK